MRKKAIEKEIRKKKTIVVVSIVLIFILQLQNVEAIGLFEDTRSSTPFITNDYTVKTAFNVTTVTFYGYLLLLSAPSTQNILFALNISYSDLPEEVDFSLIPMSIYVYPMNSYTKLSAGWYQCGCRWYLNRSDVGYTSYADWYASGSLFESQLSAPFFHGYVIQEYLNFTKIGNNLYSPAFKINQYEYVNLFAIGDPYIQFKIEINLYHDYAGIFEPPTYSIPIPFYNPNNVRDVPEGNVWDRFIVNASNITILIGIPLYISWKLNTIKVMPFLMIVMNVVAYTLSYISLIGLILGIICALLMFMDKSELNEGVE